MVIRFEELSLGMPVGSWPGVGLGDEMSEVAIPVEIFSVFQTRRFEYLIASSSSKFLAVLVNSGLVVSSLLFFTQSQPWTILSYVYVVSSYLYYTLYIFPFSKVSFIEWKY